LFFYLQQKTAWKRMQDIECLETEISKCFGAKKRGELLGADHVQLGFMKTARHFPDTYKDMKVEALESATKHIKQLIAAKWIRENNPESRRSHELYHMFNVSGMPEQAVFMETSLQYLQAALKQIDIDDVTDAVSTFCEDDINRASNPKEMQRLLDASCLARNGRDQTTRTLPLDKEIISKIRREAQAHGFTLNSSRVGPKSDRRRIYNIVPDTRLESFLPHFVVNTRKRVFSGAVQYHSGSLEGDDRLLKKRKMGQT
jgi:hypothetical protein